MAHPVCTRDVYLVCIHLKTCVCCVNMYRGVLLRCIPKGVLSSFLVFIMAEKIENCCRLGRDAMNFCRPVLALPGRVVHPQL